MPVLMHVSLWWLLGLFLETGQLPWAVLLGGGVSWALGARRRAWRVAPLFAVAGGCLATAARLEHEACLLRVRAAVDRGDAVWAITDDGAAARRGVVRDRTMRPRCELPAQLRWQGPPPRAGQLVAVRALATVGPHGVRLEQTRVVAQGPIDRLRNWRASIGQFIDARFGERAPLVRALLIADQRAIDPALRDRYADAGLVHMLSVSGMHVAIIASALLTLGGMARIPRTWLEPTAFAVVALYVILLGCPPPAVRSAVMQGVLMLSQRLQRPLHEWTALTLGAVVPTVDPTVVHDLGWQLSVSGMAALVAARALRRRGRVWAQQHPFGPTARHRVAVWLLTRRGVPGWVMQEAGTGLIAILITAPIITWTFGRLSLVAPLSNLLAVPVVGLLQPTLFLALLCAPSPGLSQWVADAAQPLMAALDLIATGAASLPGAVLPVAPTWTTAMLLGVAAILAVRATASPRPRGWIVAVVGTLVLALWTPLLDRGSGQLELHVLDVGQGDALALRLPHGDWVIVDAGPRWDGGDAGRRVVVPWIRRRGGRVALMLLTHPHDDHAGGAASVVRALKPIAWGETGRPVPNTVYRRLLETLADVGTRWQQVVPGDRWALDGVTLEVLAPDTTWASAQEDLNETSVVLMVRYGDHRFLLTGDAERGAEQWLLQRYPTAWLRADVLKVGHHGSRSSTTRAFLDVVQPRVAIASLGQGNRYGHPAVETLAALLARKVPLLRTDLDGPVIVRSDGRELTVASDGDEWRIPDS